MRWFLLKSIGSSLRYLLTPFLRANAVVGQYPKSLVFMKPCAWLTAVNQFLMAVLRIFIALADQWDKENE
ncbi:MAG: hypothetical protein JOZ62_08080 [Acidobacteriaceae bacterium]|nr:hypothetical protein [Acidobacteriaceae bacterium]